DVMKLRQDLALSKKIDKDLNPGLVIDTLEDIFVK
ncbi:unnamed protein product, partial [marine sediment metagenome]